MKSTLYKDLLPTVLYSPLGISYCLGYSYLEHFSCFPFLPFPPNHLIYFVPTCNRFLMQYWTQKLLIKLPFLKWQKRMRNDLWSHLALTKIIYFFLIQNERLSQWALALRAYFHSWLKGCMKISPLSSLYSVSQQPRENFISPRQHFNPPPTSLCMAMELWSLLYHYTPSFCLAFQLTASKFVLRLYVPLDPYCNCSFMLHENMKTLWLSPLSLLKLMTNILTCLKLCLEVFSMTQIAEMPKRVLSVAVFIR